MIDLNYSNWKRLNTASKVTVLLSGVIILSVIVVTVCTRNHVQKPEESPQCSGNLLDRREHHYAREVRGSYDNSRMISKLGLCQLLHFTFENVVGCLDALYELHYSARNSSSSNKRLHFAFIGDSRIRQQFLNFLKLIPDYDRKSQPSPIPPNLHGDIEVTSDTLALHLSFQWQPILNDTVMDTIRHWATDSQSVRPQLIIIGIALWHMMQSEGADHQLYQKKLKRLAPFLGQLGNLSKVIWLNQFPTIDNYMTKNDHTTDIFSGKIHSYNQAIRLILGDYKSVRIWDSGNPLAEEYIRGCALSHRTQLNFFGDPADSYVNCLNYIHPGYSALSQSTQLLFNDLCNSHKLYGV